VLGGSEEKATPEKQVTAAKTNPLHWGGFARLKKTNRQSDDGLIGERTEISGWPKKVRYYKKKKSGGSGKTKKIIEIGGETEGVDKDKNMTRRRRHKRGGNRKKGTKPKTKTKKAKKKKKNPDGRRVPGGTKGNLCEGQKGGGVEKRGLQIAGGGFRP